MGTRPTTTGWLEFAAVLALLFVPITGLRADAGDYTFVMLWGFLNTAPLDPSAPVHVYTIREYVAAQPRPFGSLPASIQLWPVAFAFHLIAGASAAAGLVFGREDRRVTGGLLVLAGVASLSVAYGLALRAGVGVDLGLLSVLPVGAVVTWTVAGLLYRRDLRRVVADPGPVSRKDR